MTKFRSFPVLPDVDVDVVVVVVPVVLAVAAVVPVVLAALVVFVVVAVVVEVVDCCTRQPIQLSSPPIQRLRKIIFSNLAMLTVFWPPFPDWVLPCAKDTGKKTWNINS